MIKKTLLFSFFISSIYASSFTYSISKIDEVLEQKMIKGNTYSRKCPVPSKNLRYLKLTHLGFDGKDKIGELIVHKDIANNTVEIFRKLYDKSYPIYKMKLINEYKGNDWLSIEKNNTSAFNCRKVEGSSKWSNHAYGKAIDINPIQNPYISKNGNISHKESLKYKQRVHKENTYEDKAVLLKNDEIVKIFKSYGWKWGGDWKSIKDYQHFEYKK